MSEEPEVEPEFSTTSSTSAKRKDKAREAQRRSDEALRVTMSTKEGRHTMWRVLKTSRFHLISFTGGSETFFREGMRAVGKLVYDEAQRVCPDLYTLMMSENEPKEVSNG